MTHRQKPTLRTTVLALSLGYAVLPATMAVAQGLASVPNTMTPIYINNTIGLVGIDAARQANRIAYPPRSNPAHPRVTPRTEPKPRRTAPANISWTVGTDAAATAQVRDQFFNLIRRNYNPTDAKKVMETYTRKPVRAAFREAAGPFGLSDRDFRDVATAYFVTGYMVANQAPIPTRAQVAGVRAQIAAAMAESPPAYGSRARQVAAEQMMYELTAMIYARQEGESTRNSVALSSMANATAAAYRKQGLDLRRVMITNHGFAAR